MSFVEKLVRVSVVLRSPHVMLYVVAHFLWLVVVGVVCSAKEA